MDKTGLHVNHQSKSIWPEFNDFDAYENEDVKISRVSKKC